MGKLRIFGSWLWQNWGNALTVGGWLVSIGFFPALLSLTKQASPLDYGIAVAAGALLFVVIRALLARTRIWRAEARVRERLSSESSPFDPMDHVYRDKRLFIRDLAPAGRQQIIGKKFINCEIIGPANVVPLLRSSEAKPLCVFQANTFFDVDFIQIDRNCKPNNAIGIVDCDFEGCHFYSISMLFIERINDAYNWITPRADQQEIELGPEGRLAAEIELGRKRVVDE